MTTQQNPGSMPKRTSTKKPPTLLLILLAVGGGGFLLFGGGIVLLGLICVAVSATAPPGDTGDTWAHEGSGYSNDTLTEPSYVVVDPSEYDGYSGYSSAGSRGSSGMQHPSYYDNETTYWRIRNDRYAGTSSLEPGQTYRSDDYRFKGGGLYGGGGGFYSPSTSSDSSSSGMTTGWLPVGR